MKLCSAIPCLFHTYCHLRYLLFGSSMVLYLVILSNWWRWMCKYYRTGSKLCHGHHTWILVHIKENFSKESALSLPPRPNTCIGSFNSFGRPYFLFLFFFSETRAGLVPHAFPRKGISMHTAYPPHPTPAELKPRPLGRLNWGLWNWGTSNQGFGDDGLQNQAVFPCL